MPEISLTFLAALAYLNDDDREIVIDRVVVGVSLQAIAERFGVTKEAIRQREKRALGRLRSILVDDLGWTR